MIRVVFRDAIGGDLETDVAPGTRVLDAAAQAGARVQTQCGGVMACTACRIAIRTPQSVSKAGEKERRLLALLNARDDERLACQARIQAPTEVEVLAFADDEDDVTLD